MGKIWIEVCLISARGLRRSSSLWKLQWYGVGWIDPKDKYCTNIDASGNANPVWNTKFATCIDDLESKINDLELHVEVYSRDPIFLREKLQGTATIILKEFLAKFKNNSGVSRSGTEEVGSYQLRKRNSNKPQGFIDVSIRISQDREEPTSYLGNGEEMMDLSSTITLATRDGSGQDYPAQLPLATFRRPQNQTQPNSPYAHPMPFPTNYSNLSAIGPSYPPAYGPSYHPPRTPPPPLRSNVGYVPAFLQNSKTYINMPPSGAGRGGGSGFGMGVGAGALAAGAVMFGDDFMSGFDVPSGFQDPNIVVSLDPPF